jgi:hypothetical protein
MVDQSSSKRFVPIRVRLTINVRYLYNNYIILINIYIIYILI